LDSGPLLTPDQGASDPGRSSSFHASSIAAGRGEAPKGYYGTTVQG